MCQRITIEHRTKDIETPADLKAAFGLKDRDLIIADEYYIAVDDNSCLCQLDVEETLSE